MHFPRFGFALRCGGLSAVLVFVSLISRAGAASETLVPQGASWRYFASGGAAPAGWNQPAFDDSAWLAGAAKIGIGHADQATLLPSPVVTPRVSFYFRRQFTLPSPASGFTGLLARVVCDAGAVLYLNGTEVGRIRMPAGAVTSGTLASSEPGYPAKGALFPLRIGPQSITEGANTIAVEVHGSSTFDTDRDFDLELIGSRAATPAFVVRGPYLQNGSPDSVTVRWRTDVPTPTDVRMGPTPATLDVVASIPAQAIEHEVRVDGLQPGTPYYYGVGNGADVLEGGSSECLFRTPPAVGAVKPVRVWLLGDCGTGRRGAGLAEAVREGYLRSPLYRAPDVWLMLGDNAYNSGSDDEYQNGVFDTYRATLRGSILWSALGNHEMRTTGTPYFSIFTLPSMGEGGGLASGTEHYYSFDYANIHFVCLDSQDSNRLAGNPMLTWLEADLASTVQRWIVAFWHHPPYTKGTHDSDFEIEHIEMRENALPILEQYGVDLVVCGHSHVYERSYLIDGHYGFSWEWNPASLVDAGSGRADELDGAYGKDPGPHNGAVYCVSGSAGQPGGGSLNHPAMFLSLNELGSLILDVNGDRLDAKFINPQGIVRDYFTISKAPLLTISAPQPRMAEQDEAPGRARLVRSRQTPGPMTVKLSLAGTATPGADYSAPLLPAIIPDGSLSLDLLFYALPDTLAEGTETISLTLLADDSYRLPKLGRTVSLSIADRPVDDWRFHKFGANANDPLIAGDAADPDGDGQSNILEYLAGTEPLNAASRFTAALTRNAGGGVIVRFFAQKGHAYSVQYCSSLSEGAWQTLGSVAAPALDQIVEMPDASADVATQRFYRVTTTVPP